MTCNKDWIQEYKDSYNHTVTVANNSTLETMGLGQVDVVLKDQSKHNTILNVLHVPNLSTNLLSVSYLAEKGCMVLFDKNQCTIFPNSDVKAFRVSTATASNENGLYKLELESAYVHLATNNAESQQIWDKC